MILNLLSEVGIEISLFTFSRAAKKFIFIDI